MSKRILSLVLCLSLLLTCLSGLTLIASGDGTDTPNYVYVDMTTADWSGSVNATQIHTNGATAFDAEAGAWKYCETNAGVHFTVPNCGLSSSAIAVTVKYNLPTDYVDDNTRWTIHIGDTFYYLRAVGWTNDFGDQLVNGLGDDLVRGEDATYTFIVTGADAATLAAGTDLKTYMWGANAPENEHFYIKSITIKSVDYAKVDFSTGKTVGTNASLWYNHSAEDAQNNKGEMEDVGTLNNEGLVQMADGAYAMALYEQNRGFGVQVENFGLTGTEDVAVTVEYYIPEGVAQDSTRYNMVIADKNYTLRVGGSGENTNNAAMTVGRWAASTFIVSGEAAAKFGEDSFQLNTFCWNHNNNGYNNPDWGGDYYYIRSISFMAASKLNEPEDPGYDYYDFVNKVAVNPNYPDYKQDDVLNMVWSLNNGEGNGKVTDKGMEMTSGTLYFNSTRAMNQSDVAVRLYFAEGTTGNVTFQYNADEEKNEGYDGNLAFKTLDPSPVIDENGVATVIPTDAKFAGKQQGAYSFRIYADGKTLERVEVYVLGNKTELQAAVDGEITDLSIYSKDSAKAYTDALNAAKAVLAQDIATQQELDVALKTLTTARDSLKQTVFTLPNPNFTNKDEETNPLVSTFEEKQCLSWVGGGAWSYNGGSIMTALGLTEGQIADLKIKLTVYWQATNGEGDWWHFNTYNEDGTSAPSLSGTPNDSGFGGFKDYGMVPNAWSNITIERERQQLNTAVDNLFVNVGGLAEGNALYIAGMLYQATLEDGTVLTGIWGEMMPDPADKTALEEAVNATIDFDAYSADSVAAYKAAVAEAKTVLEDESASQDDVDAALEALTTAKEALKQVRFILPNPNWTNKDEETNPMISTFEEKQCLSWVSGGAWSYNGGSIMTALGLTEGQIADLKIKLTVYWQATNGEGDWWHFNTLNEDGTSAPSLSGTPNDSGFGGFKDYGMVPNAWSNITIERERQQLNAAVDNLFVNVGGLAEGNALYIAGMLYQATLEDGTVLTGIWGEMMPDPVDKTALEEAINATIDFNLYTDESVEAYKAAVAEAKTVLEDESASQDDVDAAVAALKAAKDALKGKFAEINFADDKVNTVNGAIQHSHPDEDDGDADNGIYKVAEDVDAYGVKLSVQNHGFGFGINMANCSWITADAKLQLVVTYYAPSDKVQDNSRVGYSFDASNYSPLLFGKDMAKDEVATFTYTLTAEEVNKVVANKLFHLLFWNYADDPSNGDEVYVLSARLQPYTVVAGDNAALKAAVAEAEALSADLYTADSFKALTDALTAAKALLETTATQDDLDAAAAALAKAVEGLVMDSWDLVVESVTTNKGMNIKVGEAVKFTIVIKNVGTKAIPEGGKYGAVIKVNGATAAWSDNYKTTDTAAALEPGQTMTLTTCGGPDGADGSWKSDEVGEFTILAFVNDNPADGIQNELDRDNNTLEATLKVSEEGVKVDDLQTEISKVDEIELDKYTEESVKAVEDALAAAKAVLSDANATQADIDKALADLAAAIAKLEESEPSEVLYGDANGDGKITTADAALVLQYAAELIKDDALNLAAADVNGDGKVTTADAALILQYAAELIKEFPAASK